LVDLIREETHKL